MQSLPLVTPYAEEVRGAAQDRKFVPSLMASTDKAATTQYDPCSDFGARGRNGLLVGRESLVPEAVSCCAQRVVPSRSFSRRGLAPQ